MTLKFDDLCGQIDMANSKVEIAEREQAILITENTHLKQELIRLRQVSVSTKPSHTYTHAHIILGYFRCR